MNLEVKEGIKAIKGGMEVRETDWNWFWFGGIV